MKLWSKSFLILIAIFLVGIFHLFADVVLYSYGFYQGLIRQNFVYDLCIQLLPMIYFEQNELHTLFPGQPDLVRHILNLLSIMWIYITASVIYVLIYSRRHKTYFFLPNFRRNYYFGLIPLAVLLLLGFPFEGKLKHSFPYSAQPVQRATGFVVNFSLYYWLLVVLVIAARREARPKVQD